MKEFMMSALPLVIAGLCVAVLAVCAGRKESKKQETYMGEGMCLGMLIGEVIGMLIPKKKDTKEENDEENQA